MIKLFACDLDGTLLNTLHTTDAFILDTIDMVIKSGRYFAISTGRHMHADQLKDMKFAGREVYVIKMNGARIESPNGTLLYEKAIDKAFLRDLLTTFPEINFECGGLDKTYSRISKEAFFRRMNESVWSNVVSDKMKEQFFSDHVFDCDDGMICSQTIYKIDAHLDDESKLKDDLMSYIKDHEDIITNASFRDDGIEITDASVSKGNSVAILCHYLNIEEDECAVYGDGGNDVAMLERFKHSYAPSNATKLAKKAAHEHIGSVNTYAVTRHIRNTLKHD